jgi:thiamine transporter ThiT
MKKYLITSLSACVLELCSTLYITTVSQKSAYMLLMAFIAPFLTLPFAGFMVESKNWGERVKLAFAMGFGYFCGSLIVYICTYAF